MRALLFAVLTGAFIAGCGGGGGGDSKPPPETHSLGGTVTGFHGTGLVLANNGGASVAVPAGAGTFTFATSVATGTSFNVAVTTQPTGPSQTCVVAHGSGTVTGTDVTNVAVTCTDNSFTVGGKVTGLVASGLTLTLDIGSGVTQTIAVPAAGPYNFAFPTAITSGRQYTVRVATAPTNPAQGCGVAHASGTLGSAAVTDVAVSCATATQQLLVHAYSYGLVSYYIDPATGAIAASSGPVIQLTSTLTGLTTDPSRHVLYATYSGTPDNLRQYNFDASNGAPLLVPGAPVEGSRSDEILVLPNDRFAYGTYAYARDLATGYLTFLPGTHSGAGFIDASSSFGYYRVSFFGCGCFVLGGSAIDAATGALNHFAMPPSFGGFYTDATMMGAIEPQGRYFLFAARERDGASQNVIGAYSIDANTGILTKLSGVPRPSAQDLTGLVIHPNGRFLYVTDGASVWSYSIDAGTGALTTNGVMVVNGVAELVEHSSGGSITSLGPYGKQLTRFDVSAQYLYVGNRSAKTIAALAIDPNTGSMALVPGSPFVVNGDNIDRFVVSRIP